MYSKYHGCGNDFIITKYNEELDYNELSRKMCNRYVGIGADTFIVVKETSRVINNEKIQRVDFYNADGSLAPMCGNGIRCAALYLKNNNLSVNNPFIVETMTGDRLIREIDGEFQVNMGKPSYDLNRLDIDKLAIKKSNIDSKSNINNVEELFDYNCEFKDKIYNLNAIFMTTHHLVVPVDTVIQSDECGDFFCKHKLFTKMINVDFVEIVNRKHIKVRTYERGVGWTLACGSGATASVAVLNRKGLVDDEVKVEFKLGVLTITKENDEYLMRGPAVEIANNINFKL